MRAPSCANCSPPDVYYSEHGQDRWLEEHIFRGKRAGTFVEFGAIDGLLFSNTLFFEQERGWDGLLIEANLQSFHKLIASGRRASQIWRGAVGPERGIAEFTEVDAVTGWSGLSQHMDDRHRHRIDQVGGVVRKYEVRVFPLAHILRTCRLHHVDYMSIDVEGAEFAILNAFDFDSFDIDIIEIENNYGETAVEALMSASGYRKIHTLEINDIYRRV